MHCKKCKSGYPVLITGSKGFCGFCGSPMNAVEFKPVAGYEPLYSDQATDITLTLNLQNLGVEEIDIDKIEISTF